MGSARRKQAAVVLWVLAGLCPCAFGLNPSLDINQYAHKAWTIREGFFKGVIQSIAQTPDGYLWLGTEFGLLRFDGIRAVPWPPPGPQELPGSFVNQLFAARDGTLWIGTRTGLASWNGAKLTRYPEFDGKNVWSILEDRGGELWVGGWQAGAPGWLCSIHGGRTQCYGKDGAFGVGVFSLHEDVAGNLWAGAGTGLWRWKPDPPKRYTTSATEIRSIIQGDEGKLLIATSGGVKQLINGKVEPYPLARAASVPYRLLRDRDGGLWIATYGQGLIHVHQGRTDVFSRADGLSSDEILSVFEDCERNIWAATSEGLDRFRELPVVTISDKQGLSNDVVASVLVARDGGVWLSGPKGLDRWKDGRVSTFRKADGLPADSTTSLFEDDGGRLWVATAGGLARFEGGRFITVDRALGADVGMTGDAEHLWVSHGRGLLHFVSGRLAEEFPWPRLGSDIRARALAVDRKRGGLWLGFYAGAGVAYFQDGQVRARYTHANGLGGEHVADVQLGQNDALWAATDGGLSIIRQGHLETLSSKNGLPCETVHWRTRADDRSAWLYMSCGLVRIAQAELDAWMANPNRTVQTTVFEPSDGVRVRPTPFGPYTPHFAKSADGRLWFVAGSGVSVIDPAHLPFNKLPPPVHIEQIIADRKVVSERRLPPLTRDLEIDYTALSFVAPEKNRFKYKLEGHDRDWQDAGNRRQVFYNDLPPRNYRFRVMASNNSEMWNETGDTLEFSIAPAYYQTNWFRALLAATVLALMGAAYQFRVRLLQRESRRLRDVIETIPAYVWSALPDGFVDFINRRWLEFSGFSLDQASGWGWADAVHPEDRDRLLKAWRGALASGEALETEARMRGADGQYRWLLFRGVPQRDRSGKIVKWYGKSMDIDDRKRAEATVHETETRFRTYIDQATDAFFVLDFEGGTILDVNRRACENLGYTREEIIGKTVFDFDAALDPEDLNQNIRPRIEAGESVTFERRHRRKDGSVFPVEIRARAYRIGERIFNLSLALDITERKQSEEERERLRQLETDLAHINRVSMMGELSASIAHEINQPLTGIVSNGSACLRWLGLDGPVPAPDATEVREAVRDMVRDGKRAGEIIARIRALTKRTAPPREQLDLNETIREVLALAGDEAKKNGVTVRTQFADEVSPVQGDRVQLQQVLLNLVMNAIQAMSSVTDRARQLVIATRSVEQDRVEVKVEDSGIGLDADKIARIFDAFYTTKTGGMGMGLSICRSIVQNHGGRLWATANDGPGATFHFTLPKHQEEKQNSGAAAD